MKHNSNIDPEILELMERLDRFSLEHPDNQEVVATVKQLELVVLSSDLFLVVMKRISEKKAKKLGIYDDVKDLFARYVSCIDGMQFGWTEDEDGI